MLMGVLSGIYAFDRELNGGWGLIESGGEKIEFIRFNNDEIIFMDTLFRKDEYKETADTIFFDERESLIQYYLLNHNKLLFILWDMEDSDNSVTLILSRF
jgi:hypothetical protein